MFFIHLPGLVSGVLISSTSGIFVPETGGGGTFQLPCGMKFSRIPRILPRSSICLSAKLAIPQKKIPQNLLHVFRFLNFG